MAKERPVTAGGATADTRGREVAPPSPHAARTPPAPAPVAPGPRRPATGGPTDPRPIASPFLTEPAGAPQPPAPQEITDPNPAPAQQETAGPTPAPAQETAGPTSASAQEIAGPNPALAQQETAGLDPAPAQQGTVDAGRRPAPHPPVEETQPLAPSDEHAETRPKPVGTGRPDLPSDAPEHPGDQRDAPTRGVAKVPAPRPPWPGLQLQPMVHVADMPAAVAFYEKLGGDLVHGDRDGDWVLMQVGTSQIGLVTRPPDPARGESTVELNFSATMPLDRLERLLRKREVRIVRMAVDPDLGTRLHVETPDGMPIKIHQVEPDLLV